MVTFSNGSSSAEQVHLRLKKCDSPSEWIRSLTQLKDEGYKPKLVVLDVGLVNQLSEINQKNLRECFEKALEGDGEGLASLFITRSKYPDRVIMPEVFKHQLMVMVGHIKLNNKGQLLLRDLFAVDIVQKFAQLIRTHHISLDGDFSGLLCASMIVEGIGRSLNANLDVLPILTDYLTI